MNQKTHTGDDHQKYRRERIDKKRKACMKASAGDPVKQSNGNSLMRTILMKEYQKGNNKGGSDRPGSDYPGKAF